MDDHEDDADNVWKDVEGTILSGTDFDSDVDKVSVKNHQHNDADIIEEEDDYYHSPPLDYSEYTSFIDSDIISPFDRKQPSIIPPTILTPPELHSHTFLSVKNEDEKSWIEKFATSYEEIYGRIISLLTSILVPLMAMTEYGFNCFIALTIFVIDFNLHYVLPIAEKLFSLTLWFILIPYTITKWYFSTIISLISYAIQITNKIITTKPSNVLNEVYNYLGKR